LKVAIVKYNAGNVQSLSFALNKLGISPEVTDSPEALKSADKVIFPGQGEASSAMNYLKDKGLDQVLRELKQPFLGICLGMQLMCEWTEENDTDCLGIVPVKVKRFTNAELKVPHMGWNDAFNNKGALMAGIEENSYMYFVHSYYVESCDWTVSQCHYGLDFSTALQKDNFYAVQPHPEKSAEIGHKVLENFLKIS